MTNLADEALRYRAYRRWREPVLFDRVRGWGMIKPGSKVIVDVWGIWDHTPTIHDWEASRQAVVVSIDKALRVNVALDVCGQRTTSAERGFRFALADLVEVV